MNTTRYNTKKCKGCEVYTSVLLSKDDIRAIDMHDGWPQTQPVPTTPVRRHSSGSLVCSCRGCGKAMWISPVQGTLNVSHECNAKCLSSHGFVCECSCGGKNHGASHAP